MISLCQARQVRMIRRRGGFEMERRENAGLKFLVVSSPGNLLHHHRGEQISRVAVPESLSGRECGRAVQDEGDLLFGGESAVQFVRPGRSYGGRECRVSS